MAPGRIKVRKHTDFIFYFDQKWTSEVCNLWRWGSCQGRQAVSEGMCCKGYVKRKDETAGRTTPTECSWFSGSKRANAEADPGQVCRVALITAPGSNQLRPEERERQKHPAQALEADLNRRDPLLK